VIRNAARGLTASGSPDGCVTAFVIRDP